MFDCPLLSFAYAPTWLFSRQAEYFCRRFRLFTRPPRLFFAEISLQKEMLRAFTRNDLPRRRKRALIWKKLEPPKEKAETLLPTVTLKNLGVREKKLGQGV